MVEFYLDYKKGSKSHGFTPEDFQETLPFHALDCGFFAMGDRYYTRRDGTENYLLIVTVDGRGKMTWNGASCVLEPGSAVLIDCNIYQDYRTVPGEEWSFYYLHFQALSMEGYRNIFLRRLTPVKLRMAEPVKEWMEQIYQSSFHTNAAGYIRISNYISNLLTEMVCSLADDKESDTQLNRADISDLAEHIRKHYREDLHIEDFMRFASLSRHYLIHVFERQMGMPPYRYLHMCRINRAQILLKSTDLSVAQIAEQVGYNSVAVFIRHFKSFIGVSPGVFRNESVRT